MKIRISALLTSAFVVALNMSANGDIVGRVFNKETKAPLDYATVVLVDPATGTNLPVGTMSDGNGYFQISDVADGEYIVRISQVGIQPLESMVKVGSETVDLGNLELSEDSMLLEEVVVTGQKSQMSVDGERRLYNVKSNISSSGASAEELLASVPSVDVNADGEVSLRGNSDVLIWINGKAMGMNDDNRSQILRQIPADAIESVEVMTNPSSKHRTDGTAGIINIRLKEDNRHGYFGSADAGVDSRGTVNAGFNINFNSGKFESFAGLGLKAGRVVGGSTSDRRYDDGGFLSSHDRSTRHDNSIFLRLGTNYRPDDHNMVYISAIGTLGHKWGKRTPFHSSNLPGLWETNSNITRESGDNKGANILVVYRHDFSSSHSIDMNVSYNVWQGNDEYKTEEREHSADGAEEILWMGQRQDVSLSNWEASLDYNVSLTDWLGLEAGYKGNYNRENSPASYSSGEDPDNLTPLNPLYNRFKYDTDITAIYLNLTGKHADFTYSAGLRGEGWQIRTRSLGYGQSDADVPLFKRNQFSLFPSASVGWSFLPGNELKLNYSRRIRRPYGPMLNTFENISDPSEVHLGNPEIMPEYSNSVELSYTRDWSHHMLFVTGYFRSNTDMISHVSFLAPMITDPDVNTMYYGHANVGNMINSGVEIISRNTLWDRLTLTTTLNLYNSHLKGWETDYPLRDSFYRVRGAARDRFVWDIQCMASVRLPWDLTFQASGRYRSRRITAQGTLESTWDVEAGLRRNFGKWSVSLLCKDIFNSKESRDILYGNGYRQDISKWSGGRTLRLSVSYNFGKSMHDEKCRHNHVDTGGYGEEHSH